MCIRDSCIALSLTACGGKQSSNTDSKNTQTEAGTEASGKSDSRLDDLYQQENQLFADHADAWNKAFGMMNKSDADPNGNYADYLAGTVESNKDSFTDDELKTLNADIETIRKIEEPVSYTHLDVYKRQLIIHTSTSYQKPQDLHL